MNYSFYDFLTLCGSLGMFLYGMKTMSEGLQKVAGDRLRGILTAMTRNRVMGALTGVLITALIQSSSATTVMVVSFVNAGLLTLAQSITVIMGANVGTTVTAWIITLFGFKFSISAIALPMIGISIPLLFSKSSTRKSWGEFLIGFALLFMGLDFLKNSVPDIKSNPGMLAFLTNYTSMGYASILLFLLIGTILTIIVQSSSATMAITLIMCSKGWISFEIAAAMVLGENIGTTITANLAALSANVSAKRAALSHFMFNIFGVIWVVTLFFPFTGLVRTIIDHFGGGNPDSLKILVDSLSPEVVNQLSEKEISDDLKPIYDQYMHGQVSISYALSMFHTMFNIINVFLMIWFVKGYVFVVSKLIKQKYSDEDFHLQHISTGMLSTAEIGIIQAKKEMGVYVQRTNKMFSLVQQLRQEKAGTEAFVALFSRIEKYEKISDRMEVEIARYLNQLGEGRLSSESKHQVRRMLNMVTEIESIGDSCYNIARTIKRKKDANVEYSDEMIKNLNSMFALVQKSMDYLGEALSREDVKEEDVIRISNTEAEINNLRGTLRSQNLIDVNNLVYDYQTGIFYMDTISECEKLADYVMNVIEAATEK